MLSFKIMSFKNVFYWIVLGRRGGADSWRVLYESTDTYCSKAEAQKAVHVWLHGAADEAQEITE